jgi:hypothetical protein
MRIVRFKFVIVWSSKFWYHIKEPILTQKLKLLGEVSRNDLYYSLINNINKNKILINLQIITLLQYSFDCSEDIDLQNLIQLRLCLFCTCFCVCGAKNIVRCLVTVKTAFCTTGPTKKLSLKCSFREVVFICFFNWVS